MKKSKFKSGGSLSPQDWEKYEEDVFSYSYIKKKGKHKRAEKNLKN
jgi:hypothetical protein